MKLCLENDGGEEQIALKREMRDIMGEARWELSRLRGGLFDLPHAVC